MALPFPVCFWGGEPTISILTKSWSENLSASETLSFVKQVSKTWSENLAASEFLTIDKTSVKSWTVTETASLAEGWVRTIQALTPAAPSSLDATRQANAGGVNLTWVDNSNNETSFVIERSLNGSSWTEVKTVAANSTSTTDWATVPVTLPSISSIDSQNDDKINVTWGSVSDATQYRIYRSTTAQFVPGDSNSVYVAQTASTTYQITGLVQNTQYYVIVRAENTFGEGAFSAISGQVTGPTVPQNFAYPYNTDRYNLSWTNGTRDDDTVRVERSLNSGGSWTEITVLSAGSTSYSDIRAFSASTLYRIRYTGEVTYAT